MNNKLRNIGLGVLALSAVTLSSCSDSFLDEELTT